MSPQMRDTAERGAEGEEGVVVAQCRWVEEVVW